MPNPSIIAGIASGGRGVIPPKPTLSHTANGQYTITNYSASYTYTNSGATRSSNILTDMAGTGSVNVTAKSAKGIISSAIGTLYRQQPTTDMVYQQNYWGEVGCGSCTHNCPNYCGGCGECACSYYPSTNTCGRSTGCQVCYNHDYSGAGYISEFGEWSKVS